MNDDVSFSIRQMEGAWRVMCAAGPSPVAATTEGIRYIFSGVPISFFNIAVLTGTGLSAEVLGTRGREACAWAAGQSVPWLLVVTHEQLEAGVDAAATLEACGLTAVMPLTGMRARTVAAAPTVPGLQLTVPQSDSGCAAIVDINSLAYGMDLGASKGAIGSRTFWTDHFPVVGVADGKPVSSAAVLMVGGYRYVVLVATDPGLQRRGFGDATMRRALANAASAHGEAPTVLHATDAGRPVYERMGYSNISTHTLLMEKRSCGNTERRQRAHPTFASLEHRPVNVQRVNIRLWSVRRRSFTAQRSSLLLSRMGETSEAIHPAGGSIVTTSPPLVRSSGPRPSPGRAQGRHDRSNGRRFRGHSGRSPHQQWR